MKFITYAAFIFLGFCFFVANANNKSVDSAETLTQIMKERHSGNLFDLEKSVSADKITSLVHAAQSAPSSYNEQPWNFIICDKTRNPNAYNKIFSTLHKFNQNWAKNAPILILTTVSKNLSKNNEPNLWAEYDTGAAALSMCLQATASGLMAHQIAGFDQVKVSKLLDLPENTKPISIIAIGYEDLTRSKPKIKERKATNENFFQDTWGLPNNNWK
jgi:nitroreductase